MNGPASLAQIGCGANYPEEFMISAPKDIFGKDVFELFAAELGTARVCKLLSVSHRTVQRWMSGATPVPKMAVLALFWETHYGRSLIESEMINEIRLLYFRNTLLQEQFIKAKDMVAGLRRLHTGTANEPLFEELRNDYEKEDFQSQFVALGRSKHPSPLPAHQADSRPEIPAKSQTDKDQAVKANKKAAAA
jgi:hypothetical protein